MRILHFLHVFFKLGDSGPEFLASLMILVNLVILGNLIDSADFVNLADSGDFAYSGDSGDFADFADFADLVDSADSLKEHGFQKQSICWVFFSLYLCLQKFLFLRRRSQFH